MSSSKVIAMLNCHDDDVFCFRKEIIDCLADRGYTVLVSCPYGSRIENIRRENVVFENISIDRRGTNPIKDYNLYKEYVRLFKKYQPIVVLAFTIKPNIYGGLAARKLKIPYVNNITGLGSGFENGGFVKRVILSLYKIVFASSYKVFFQNETNKNKILDTGILQHNRFEVIPGSGVNLSRFSFCDYPEDGELVFNYIGRVMKDKNIDDYFYIAKAIRKEFSNTRFNVIGFIEETEPYYKEELDSLEKQGIINYLGAQQDVRPFIIKSHAIIHPSTYGEGLSNVLIESAAMGRALLTTTVPGCGETVEEGVNGFHFSTNDKGEMVETIRKFILLPYDDKKAMGRASRKMVEEKYDRNIVVKKYSDIVNELDS